jgi:UPF0755 protein
MYKKTVAIAIIFILLVIGSGFYISNKLKDRQARKQAYEQAQNAKAEEISLTILEGWSNREIGQYLEKQGVLKQSEFLAEIARYDTSTYESVPKEAQKNLQGFLYPDTYRFFKKITDRSQTTAEEAADTIINKLLANFEAKLPANAEALAKKQGLSLYDAIILASIVEREANNFPNEKRTIAGIFYNRLNIGMALQSDATVNYATGKNQPSPSLDDLEVDSPYNTYKHKGLPPTPIANPSIASIEAVLNPIDSEYFYYLHDQEKGQPYYAKTHDEHVANKQKYLK